MRVFKLFFTVTFLCSFLSKAYSQENGVSSPDKIVLVTTGIAGGKPYYSVSRAGKQVLERSKLGLIREDADFSTGLLFISASPVSTVTDNYELFAGKRRMNVYHANKRTLHFKTASGKLLDIIFQVSNDGVAFRYYFPERSPERHKITTEATTFNFASSAKGWLQPMADAKSGWGQANPSYEEYYQQGIPAGTPSPIKAGWVYPALFQAGENWALITETFPDRNYCGTRLKAESPEGEYAIGFPQQAEVFPGGALNPESVLPWYSPWRVIAVGTLKTIVGSSLGTDLAKPARSFDRTFVKPGKASWSWVLLKDDSTVYHVQKRFIDYAATMRWEYCLIDAGWDTQIGYARIRELADYAKTKNVGLLLWYNSAGTWNTTPQTPKNKLLTHESRVKEFGILKEMGIKGIKADFFGGDGQSMLSYYLDILDDAAAAGLMVNYHGSSLPRGLQRTYPNLVSMEAIKGMEFNTFEQSNEDAQPLHCTTIPFVRNVFDPMDYTPMALYKIPKIKRKTTSGFQLALPVLFVSGIQHLAETPEGMTHVPAFAVDYLKQLPARWDEVRFIDGFPGKLAVIARRSGKQWFVSGINGENTAKDLVLDLSFLKGYTPGTLINDGSGDQLFTENPVDPRKPVQVLVKANGGFVMLFK